MYVSQVVSMGFLHGSEVFKVQDVALLPLFNATPKQLSAKVFDFVWVLSAGVDSIAAGARLPRAPSADSQHMGVLLHWSSVASHITTSCLVARRWFCPRMDAGAISVAYVFICVIIVFVVAMLCGGATVTQISLRVVRRTIDSSGTST